MWNCNKNIVAVSMIMSFAFIAKSQDFSIYHKVKDDTLMVSWVDKNTVDFVTVVKHGYLVTLEEMNGERIFERNILPSPEKLNPLSEEDDQFLLKTVVQSDDLVNDMFAGRVDENVEDIEYLEIIHELFYFTAAKKYEYLEKVGLAFSIPVNLNSTYKVTIRPNLNRENNPSYSKTINPSDYESPSVPELSGVWENKQAILTWSHTGFVETFNFYDLYISTDSVSWERSDSTIVNFFADDEEEFQKLEIKKALENDQKYWFRLYGIDFLGERSENFKEVSGICSEGVKVSPYFTDVDQLRSNEAHMRWNIPEDSRSMVQEYRIYVAETYDGPYIPDTVGLSPQTFEIKRTIPFRSAYFRVVAVDKNEKEYSSFPQLVISVDTLAPAMPRDLEYTIDTNGILNIKWSTNDEEDFIGYKLFYCYDTTVDMTLAHNSYLITPEFQDTLELKSTNRKVYYKAISVDKRNNRSDFSEMLVVEKPDILAPIEPVFISAESGPGTSNLRWYKSISVDVKEQRLFRRKLNGSKSWELLELWDLSIDTSYTDEGLEAWQKYAYTITVIDSAGNESDPSIPVVVVPLPDYRGFDLNQWDVTNEEEHISFRHNFDHPDVEKVLLYRKVDQENLYSLVELDKNILFYEDAKVRKGKKYSYAVKVLFKEGIESTLSEFKAIER